MRIPSGDILYWIGGNAVVFKVMYHNKLYAMRCYLRSKPHLREIYGDAYCQAELEVRPGLRCDVVMCEWQEGVVIRDEIFRALAQVDRERLRHLSDSFNDLALWMLSRKGWAHGDLNLDNILICDDGEMCLIDYDANYVEALAGCRSGELGTPAFQSRWRSERDFDESIDDFSIALLTVVLRGVALSPSIVDRHPFLDGILLDGQRIDERDYAPMVELLDLFASEGDAAAYRIAKSLSYGSMCIDNLHMLISHLVHLDRDVIRSYSDDLESLEYRGIWGYCDTQSGEIIIPPIYDEAFEFRRKEVTKVRVGSYWHLIDRAGRVLESL